MTNTRSLTWDLSWGIGYREKLGPYRPPTSFKLRVRKCGLKCTWPVIGYTRIWCTGTSFLLKKSYRRFLALTPTLPLRCCCFFLLTSFCAFPTIWTPVTGCRKLDLLTIFPQGGNVTDISNSMFPLSLQNMETRYFVLWYLRFQFSHGFQKF